MTELFPEPGPASRWCASERESGRTLGFVPTMGALHEGHLALVRSSVAANDRTVVSVFVNPLQFDEASDFEAYPRDVEADARLLVGVGCDVVFTGTLAQFFPDSGGELAAVALEDPGPTARGLEGEHRAGHFAGVATIVRCLFELVLPDRAYFGEKDFQQTLVVRALAQRLGSPEVLVVPTEREPSGLARSSRNQLLDPEARRRAEALSRGLFRARDAFASGTRDAGALCATIRAELDRAELEIEYAELRDPDDWGAGPLVGPVEHARGLVAARVGAVRLIDNLRLDGGA